MYYCVIALSCVAQVCLYTFRYYSFAFLVLRKKSCASLQLFLHSCIIALSCVAQVCPYTFRYYSFAFLVLRKKSCASLQLFCTPASLLFPALLKYVRIHSATTLSHSLYYAKNPTQAYNFFALLRHRSFLRCLSMSVYILLLFRIKTHKKLTILIFAKNRH